MYRLAHGSTQNLSDVEAFIEMLNTLGRDQSTPLRNLFDEDKELFVTRAPGRLDVMGGIADYSGSLMLELPIAEATLVALQRTDDRVARIVSVTPDVDSSILDFEMPLGDFEKNGTLMSYQDACEYFQTQPENHWAAYVAGAFLVLMRERQIDFSAGAHILISSAVPLGKGVSSSAALEVAVMQDIAAAFNIALEPRELALLCQKVENLVAGAPCGVMDQMSVVCGEANRLLALLCQPAELKGTIKIPEHITFWGIDSGVRHSITGADYASVRVGTFMGYRIVADLAGLKVTADDGFVRIEDPLWCGYLANLTPGEFEAKYASQLPEAITGAEFLNSYQATSDPVTRVCADHVYAVRVPTAHAVYEHDRVRRFAELLKQAEHERALGESAVRRGGTGVPPVNHAQDARATFTLVLLGELMYQSHASYSACGLGSDGTDRLVELVREAGPAAGLYGAKITGGGSGGTVAVLGTRQARSSLERVAEQYAREAGYQPYIFEGSSPGSAAFGHLKLTTVN